MRVVLDPNVLVSAVVTPDGVCARLLAGLTQSPLTIVVSPLVLAEVDRVLARPKFSRISPAQSDAYLAFLRRASTIVDDPPDPGIPLVKRDPDDDYLVRLVTAEPDRVLVTGDPHLLELPGSYPIVSPRTLLDMLTGSEPR